MSKKRHLPQKGRGAVSNPDNRFHSNTVESVDDGWGGYDEPLPNQRTELYRDATRSVITYNKSPDLSFDRSINPYRGCEHGCVYCFARPTHAYLDLSPGLDFETKLFYKPEAAKILRQELAKKSYRCAPIALGVNTDAYQPVERQLQITRQILEVLVETRHPVYIVTKSSLIERDLDLLSELAKDSLVSIVVSLTTLDPELARNMEPRATAPHRRLQTIGKMSESGIPVSVLVAPLIPFLNDNELEKIVTAAAEQGAQQARYVFLRLPHELKILFSEWLTMHYPLKAEHIMNLIRDSRGGKEYRAEFGSRMRGEGEYAALLAQRFKLVGNKLDLNHEVDFRTDLFKPPLMPGEAEQMDLFA